MNSMIANKIEINWCQVQLNSLFAAPFLCANVYNLTYTTKTACPLSFFAYALYASNNTCLLDLYSGNLQTTTVVFTHNASSHLVACSLLSFYPPT